MRSDRHRGTSRAGELCCTRVCSILEDMEVGIGSVFSSSSSERTGSRSTYLR